VIDSFLAELGKRFAERWFTALVIPGLLLSAAAWCAAVLGHAHALDLPQLVHVTRSRLVGLHLDTASTIALALAVLLLAIAGAGAAQALAWLVQRIWLLERKQRPVSFTGRQLRLLDQRIQAEYHGLRIGLLWPRLWLLLPDSQRSAVQAAIDGIQHAALLTGWGLLYLMLSAWWWPGLVIGALHLIIARTASRTQVTAYTTLVESLVDISQHQLAAALGIALPHGVITKPEAGQLNDRLHKSDKKEYS